MQTQKSHFYAYGKFRRIFNIAFVFITFMGLVQIAAAQENIKLLAFGDSLTAGYGLPEEDAFPVRLEKALQEKGLNVTVENAGVSGDTTSGGLQRLTWALSGDPDLVLLELGANDALRGIEPAVTRKNLSAIIETLQEKSIPVMLAGMRAPPNMGAEYQKEFDDIFSNLADRYGIPLYPFFLEGVAANPELNQEDAIHPNPEGVSVIVRNMLPHVIDFVEQYQNSPQ